jgi:hypothetical protein
MGVSRVIIETDSLPVKMALESNSFALAPTGGIVYETKNLMNLSFMFVSVAYCRRDCNRVAHAVAAFGCKCPHGTIPSWESTPHGTEDLVTSDITASMVQWNESSLKKKTWGPGCHVSF